MSSEVVSYEEAAKQRFKEILMNLIPDAKLSQIVRKTQEEFERVDLPALIKEELRVRYRQLINEEFAKPEWQHTWSSVGREALDKVKQLMIESAPLVLASLFGGAMQSVVEQLKNGMQIHTW